jgi:hypothetical protein
LELKFQQDDEKGVRRVVAADLRRHFSVAFNTRWRGKPAATTFFIIPPGNNRSKIPSEDIADNKGS